jgi:putative cell wall-binding protein
MVWFDSLAFRNNSNDPFDDEAQKFRLKYFESCARLIKVVLYEPKIKEKQKIHDCIDQHQFSKKVEERIKGKRFVFVSATAPSSKRKKSWRT